MATTADTTFAKFALDLELITEKQLQKALLFQQKWKQEKETTLSLSEVLEKKGYLGPEDIQRVQLEIERLHKHQEKLPGYRIVKKLGSGGMGVVYEGFDTQHDRRVAIKVLPSKFANDEESRQRFFREAEATQRLQHPNLIQGFEILERNKKIYFVMEYVEGISVEEEILKQGPYPEPKALYVVNEVAKALGYCHEHQIIHRDIKPENILIDPQNHVKLMDLGLAKDLSQESKLTQAGMTVGTPNYIAPEQAKGTTGIDSRCDIYSLGGTLFFMLTGRIPFDGNSPLAVMNKHISEPLTPPITINEAISAGTNALVIKMMAKNPKHRYQTCQEIQNDISRIQQGDSLEEIPVKQLVLKNPLLRNSSGTRSGLRSGIRKSPRKTQKIQLLLFSLGVSGLLLTFSGLIWWKSQLQKRLQLEKQEFLQLQSQMGTHQEPAEVYLDRLNIFMENHPQSPHLPEIERSLQKLLKQKSQETEIQKNLNQIEQFITEESYLEALRQFHENQSQWESLPFLKSKVKALSQRLETESAHYYLKKIQELAQQGQKKEGLQLLTQIKKFIDSSTWTRDFASLEKEIASAQTISLFIPTAEVIWEVKNSSPRVDLKKNTISDGVQLVSKAPSERDFGGYLIRMLRMFSSTEVSFELILEQGDVGVMFDTIQFTSLQKRFNLEKNRKYAIRLVSQNSRVRFYCDKELLDERPNSGLQPFHLYFVLEGRQSSVRIFNLQLKPE